MQGFQNCLHFRLLSYPCWIYLIDMVSLLLLKLVLVCLAGYVWCGMFGLVNVVLGFARFGLVGLIWYVWVGLVGLV